MNKKNIIQFTPYYPPHVWGLENVVLWIHNNWTFGTSTVVTGDMWQVDYDEDIILLPSYELIPNFPVPLFWKIVFWKSLHSLLKKDNISWETIIITHTRFFLMSLVWKICSKIYWYKHIHIEHWSDYVKLSSRITSFIAFMYDKTFWWFTLSRTYKTLCISKASLEFTKNTLKGKRVQVWKRWFDIDNDILKDTTQVHFVYIGRLVSLKGCDTLLHAYAKTRLANKLYIIWDGEERDNLQVLCEDLWITKKVIFMWFLKNQDVRSFLKSKNNIVINPSYQEWMPTTVIEALATNNIVVASNVWGTTEISQLWDLILFEAWNIKQLSDQMKYSQEKFTRLQGLSFFHIKQNFSWEKSIVDLYNCMK